MNLQWNNDNDVNIFPNEYVIRNIINRSATRLLDNDNRLDNFFDASINHAIVLNTATREEVRTFTSSPSAAITLEHVMSLSATEGQTLSGIGSDPERFLVPSELASVLNETSVFPTITYIDIIHKGNMTTVDQIIRAAQLEIGNSSLQTNNLVYVRCIANHTYQYVYTFNINEDGNWIFVRVRNTYWLYSEYYR